MTDAARQNLLTGKRLIAEGVRIEDRELIRRAAVLFDGAQESAELSALATYYLGYAHYRMSSVGTAEERRQARGYLADAITQLKRAVKRDPTSAESHALLGFCQSLDVGHRPYTVLYQAPVAGRALGRAYDIAPNNPRVVLLNAVITLRKPALFGGDERAGVTGLERAASLFETWSPPDELQPDWGEAETYTLLGGCYARRGEPALARAAFERALSIAPDFRRAQRLLATAPAAG
jgi:tetratricopeptide (TPR) repeat protein